MAVVLGVGYGADAPGAALGEVEGVGMARTRCGQARLQLAVQMCIRDRHKLVVLQMRQAQRFQAIQCPCPIFMG